MIKLDDSYEKAWAEIAKELAAAKYPVARIAFFDQYGSGKVVSLWLAPTKEAFARKRRRSIECSRSGSARRRPRHCSRAGAGP